MFCKLVAAVALAVGAWAVFPATGAHGAVPLLPAERVAGGVSEASNEADGDTWTVKYRKPGGRWYGISGLSYYHACKMDDDLRKQGYETYLVQENWKKNSYFRH